MIWRSLAADFFAIFVGYGLGWYLMGVADAENDTLGVEEKFFYELIWLMMSFLGCQH